MASLLANASSSSQRKKDQGPLVASVGSDCFILLWIPAIIFKTSSDASIKHELAIFWEVWKRVLHFAPNPAVFADVTLGSVVSDRLSLGCWGFGRMLLSILSSRKKRTYWSGMHNSSWAGCIMFSQQQTRWSVLTRRILRLEDGKIKETVNLSGWERRFSSECSRFGHAGVTVISKDIHLFPPFGVKAGSEIFSVSTSLEKQSRKRQLCCGRALDSRSIKGTRLPSSGPAERWTVSRSKLLSADKRGNGMGEVMAEKSPLWRKPCGEFRCVNGKMFMFYANQPCRNHRSIFFFYFFILFTWLPLLLCPRLFKKESFDVGRKDRC